MPNDEGKKETDGFLAGLSNYINYIYNINILDVSGSNLGGIFGKNGKK